ncbi:hypothetical protein AVEN_80697-1, partial [Araneus ventricosus]
MEWDESRESHSQWEAVTKITMRQIKWSLGKKCENNFDHRVLFNDKVFRKDIEQGYRTAPVLRKATLRKSWNIKKNEG